LSVSGGGGVSRILELSLPGSTLLLRNQFITGSEVPVKLMKNEELLNSPNLSGVFPITFKNGYRISTLIFWCQVCNAAAPLLKVHGYLSRFVEGVADITAATKCRCGEITTYRIRLRDDKTFSYLDGNRWIDKCTVKSSWRRLRGLIKARYLLLILRCKSYRLQVYAKKLQEELKKVQKNWYAG